MVDEDTTQAQRLQMRENELKCDTPTVTVKHAVYLCFIQNYDSPPTMA
jgi:hypothetical protein